MLLCCVLIDHEVWTLMRELRGWGPDPGMPQMGW